MIRALIILAALVFLGCQQSGQQQSNQLKSERNSVYFSINGEQFSPIEPSEALLQKLDEKEKAYQENTNDVDALIWYGRFLAYAGQYDDAIELYTDGIKRFPKDDRLYRHRGHRYISIRKFDEAIQDLEKASTLIEGKENEMEPDGMPNARGIPVSSRHGNIWYHLGLAYYLKQDFENAKRSYVECRNSANNHDNIVSSTHWLYMIARRMGDEQAANEFLEPITDTMNVIENMSYHNNCRFYKGLITMDEWSPEGMDSSAGDAVLYAIGNWHFYNDNIEEAKRIYESIIDKGGWNSFGYIAAEVDLSLME